MILQRYSSQNIKYAVTDPSGKKRAAAQQQDFYIKQAKQAKCKLWTHLHTSSVYTHNYPTSVLRACHWTILNQILKSAKLFEFNMQTSFIVWNVLYD